MEKTNWFKNIQQKNLYTFTVFDIEKFYPSIAEKLLEDALAFAQRQYKLKKTKIIALLQR